jgi:DNA-binding response OmpR family regulator
VAGVLIVDDAESIRLLCRVNLELEGHRVIEAATLEAARAALAEHPVDVLLLDVHVGPHDGREFLAEVRAAHPGVRVALLTGSSDLDSVRDAGPDAVISKPFELDDLRAVVAGLAAPELSAK